MGIVAHRHVEAFRYRIRLRVGEAVLDAGEAEQLEVGAGLGHFLHEAGDLFGGNHRIGLAGGGENTRLDVTRLGGSVGAQGAMEAGHAGQVGAHAGLVQYHATAKAVADREQTACFYLLLFQHHLAGGFEAGVHLFRLGHGGFHEGFRILRVSGYLAGAVHVHRQGGVTGPGQHACAIAGVIVQAPPFVDHDHPGPGFFLFVIQVHDAGAQIVGQGDRGFNDVAERGLTHHKQGYQQQKPFHCRSFFSRATPSVTVRRNHHKSACGWGGG